jgi:hypothetical protein
MVRLTSQVKGLKVKEVKVKVPKTNVWKVMTEGSGDLRLQPSLVVSESQTQCWKTAKLPMLDCFACFASVENVCRVPLSYLQRLEEQNVVKTLNLLEKRDLDQAVLVIATNRFPLPLLRVKEQKDLGLFESLDRMIVITRCEMVHSSLELDLNVQ